MKESSIDRENGGKREKDPTNKSRLSAPHALDTSSRPFTLELEDKEKSFTNFSDASLATTCNYNKHESNSDYISYSPMRKSRKSISN